MATSGIHHSTKIYLITGDPGVGKTTLIKKLSERIKSEGIRRQVKGFYTKELRDESHSRIGFDVIDINDENNRAPLARLSSTSNSSWPKVGKYSVDLRSFESVALPNITNLDKDEIVIVDEIGKMESFSSNFNRAIGDLIKHIESTNSSILLATVPSRNLPISDKIKSHHLSKLFTVTFQNRNKIEDEILKYL